MPDYYAILGVPRTATQLEIRDAYLRLARETHPDKVKDLVERKKAEDAFKNVTAAYDTLSRERLRKEYTVRLPNAPATKPAAPAPSAPPPSPAGTPATRAKADKTIPPVARVQAMPSSGRINFDAFGQGLEALKKQDYHAAVQLLNLAVSNDETNARAHAALSMALAKNPNWVRNAITHMETAVRLEPKNAAFLAELALYLHSQGLKLRARRTLDAAIAINAEHPDVLRAQREIPAAAPEPESAASTAETSRGLFDRLRGR